MRKTIYSKIYADIIDKIKSGALKTNDTLPSTRDLAKAYRCHRLTVMNVCQDLISEGWIESAERSRYKISAKIPITTSLKAIAKTKSPQLSPLSELKPIDLERERHPIEFWGGQPDLRLFPKDEFRKILSSGLKRLKYDDLNYGLTLGIESCLKEISEYLRKSRTLLNKKYLITNGSQEALYIIFKSFVRPGDKIAVERKGYPPAWRLFESLGAKLIPIEVDSEGLNTEDLQEKMKRHKIKLIYVTPIHQYPTTVTLSPRRRQSLIHLAEKNLIPILEDDYDNEFHYTGSPMAPISAETDLGIYVCSFSKVLFPGARLGVIGCNQNILDALAQQKNLISRQTDSLTQLGLAAWIRDGGFERHLRKMRRTYEQRYYFMQTELEKIKVFKNIAWQTPNGGMSIWVNLFKDSKKIATQAKMQGVFFQYESGLDYSESIGTHLRIGFASVNEKETKDGLKILKELL